jgi:hypothetical protein
LSAAWEHHDPAVALQLPIAEGASLDLVGQLARVEQRVANRTDGSQPCVHVAIRIKSYAAFAAESVRWRA